MIQPLKNLVKHNPFIQTPTLQWKSQLFPIFENKIRQKKSIIYTNITDTFYLFILGFFFFISWRKKDIYAQVIENYVAGLI